MKERQRRRSKPSEKLNKPDHPRGRSLNKNENRRSTDFGNREESLSASGEETQAKVGCSGQRGQLKVLETASGEVNGPVREGKLMLDPMNGEVNKAMHLRFHSEYRYQKRSTIEQKRHVEFGKSRRCNLEGRFIFSGEESGQSYNKKRGRPKQRHGTSPGAQEKSRSLMKKYEVKNEEDSANLKKIRSNDMGFQKVFKRKRGRLSSDAIGNGLDKKSKLRQRHTKASMETDDDEDNSGFQMIKNGMQTGNNNDISETSSSSSKTLHIRKKFNAGKLSQTSKEKQENEKTKQKAGGQRRSTRQAVRDKIVELLLGAGWKIEYRPRKGRNYNDAVYINPEGKTHWSVTLAYRVLKKHHEDRAGDSNSYKIGFKFIPIQDEELSVLTKVISKQRSDKNISKRKLKNEKKGRIAMDEEGQKKRKKLKLQKSKLGTTSNPSYSVGKHKKGTSVSVKNHRGREAHDRMRYSLMARNSNKEAKSNSGGGSSLYDGQYSVLTWMIESGSVPLDGKVRYMESSESHHSVLAGRIRRDGIQCDCCSKTFPIAKFERHAGKHSSQPMQNMYLEAGACLLQCQLESWYKQDESLLKGLHFVDFVGEDPNDDTCGICGDGGDLICCDGCPSTFHQSCLEMENFPSGAWYCIYCSCKICGFVRDECHVEDSSGYAIPMMLVCCLCKGKYHQTCVHTNTLNNDHHQSSFCGAHCQELDERLQALLGVRHELDDGFSWTLVRRCDVGDDISACDMPRMVGCNSLVAVALDIMDECFLPMIDYRSGVNLICNVVYNFGSNSRRLDYSGFFTVVLERDDEIISVASLRIHGKSFAEMPFIGTRHTYRRQGMCRRLLNAIEIALFDLDVEKLVIPAISELKEVWTNVFGFLPLDALTKQQTKNTNLIVFPGVDMLQKSLLKPIVQKEAVVPVEVDDPIGMETVAETKLMAVASANSCECSAEIDVEASSALAGCSSFPNGGGGGGGGGSGLSASDITCENSDLHLDHADLSCIILVDQMNEKNRKKDGDDQRQELALVASAAAGGSLPQLGLAVQLNQCPNATSPPEQTIVACGGAEEHGCANTNTVLQNGGLPLQPVCDRGSPYNKCYVSELRYTCSMLGNGDAMKQVAPAMCLGEAISLINDA